MLLPISSVWKMLTATVFKLVCIKIQWKAYENANCWSFPQFVIHYVWESLRN